MSQGGHYRVGQRFGQYVLEAYVGAGAFKSVYRARTDEPIDGQTVVALGFPHQQDPEGLAELEKEFAVVRRLDHPNILRAYALERIDGIAFLVMEFVTGQTLRSRLREVGAMSPDEALKHVGLVCDALAYAHTAHILHRDVKPDNILLADGRGPLLLDFGIARFLETTGRKASTQIGTVDYMAPEQIQGASGTNADLWALGVTLYELLTGRRPFGGDAVYQQILSGKYDEKPLFDRNITGPLVRVIRKLLNKDPEARYQKAEELSSDLESLVRKAQLVDDDEGRLEVLIKARIPLIQILSYEEDRVLEAIQHICQRLGDERRRPLRLFVWSASRGLRDEQNRLTREETVEDPTAALEHVVEHKEDAVYLFLDMHRHYSPVTTRLIRDAARCVRATRKSVLFLSPFYKAPEELEKELTLSVFQLPDRSVLDQTLQVVIEEAARRDLPVELSPDAREHLLRAASGLTRAEADLAYRKALAESGGLTRDSARSVVESKTQIIRKTGLLEYYHQSEHFAAVGGMERLTRWFRTKANAFSPSARFASLPVPKGVLLVGVPGCGKSLSARAVAGTWGVPLLRLDVGRLFGAYVGQAESNVRAAIQTAEAVSPCVLWVDEIEKGLAGVGAQGGGGVTDRVFGSLLTWLEEKRSPVFVVATANDVSALPPEFIRKGRFDEIFFVGLPSVEEREAILGIHLTRRGRDQSRHPDLHQLKELAGATDGFSGAELEQTVVSGLYEAFDQDRELNVSDLADAAKNTIPLSRARSAQMARLTAWARENARPAS